MSHSGTGGLRVGSGGVGSPRAASPSEELSGEQELFFVPPKDRACSPREAGVTRMLGRNLQESIQREVDDWEAVSSLSPEVCKLCSDTVERSQALEEAGLQAFPTTIWGLHITALGVLGQLYGAEPHCCLNVRFPARHLPWLHTGGL